MTGAASILKLHGKVLMATKAPISAGLTPFIAIHAGKPNHSKPNGIPWATYRAEKIKYLRNALSERAGNLIETKMDRFQG
jgi:hypothetical protein